MSVPPSRCSLLVHRTRQEYEEATSGVLDESGSVRLSRSHLSRLGLRPCDVAVLALYRGIVCVWREAPELFPGDPDFRGLFAVRVDHDGGVVITVDHLRHAGLLRSPCLTITSWDDEVSIS